jgi:hypothetical protein
MGPAAAKIWSTMKFWRARFAITRVTRFGVFSSQSTVMAVPLIVGAAYGYWIES